MSELITVCVVMFYTGPTPVQAALQHVDDTQQRKSHQIVIMESGQQEELCIEFSKDEVFEIVRLRIVSNSNDVLHEQQFAVDENVCYTLDIDLLNKKIYMPLVIGG